MLPQRVLMLVFERKIISPVALPRGHQVVLRKTSIKRQPERRRVKGNEREWIADALATVWQTVFLAASPVGDGRG
jgi:hypothetical protein